MLKVKVFFSVFFILSILSNNKIQAQNIVSNGSFETDSICPDNYGEIEYATSWTSPTIGTPDFYDTCSNFRVTIPSNDFGIQATHSGHAYSGFGFYTNTATVHYSEYLQNHLLHPLVSGNTYYFSMYVSLGECSGKATNSIGTYFSKQRITDTSSAYFSQYTPQITTTSFITNKTSWTKVQGIYTANGGEEYITIGKFDSSSNSITPVSGTWTISNFPTGGYYYVDDVYLVDTCLYVSQTKLLRNDTSVCSSLFSLTLHANNTFDSPKYLWSTNDTTPSININQTGTFWVNILNSTGSSCVLRDTVRIHDKSVNVSLGNDTTICSNNQLALAPQHSALVNFLWQNNSTASYFMANNSGIYWVKVFNGICSMTDSIEITYTVPPKILGNNIHSCNNSAFPLKLSAKKAEANTYQWSNNSTDSFIVVNDSGLFWVTMNKNSCILSDSIHITKDILLKPDLGTDTTLCFGVNLNLNTHQAADFYNWYSLNSYITTTITPILNISGNGAYIVEAVAGQGRCKDRDTIVVNFKSKPIINLGADTMLCYHSSLQLQPIVNMSGLSFKWQNGDTSSRFIVTSAGTYRVEANNGGCKNSDSININYENQIKVDLGNDTALCSGQIFHLTANLTNATNWHWNTNDHTNYINISSPGVYWNEASKGYCKTRDSVNVSFMPNPIVNIGNDTIICANTILNLKANNTNSTFLWSNGNTSNNINVNFPGNYWIKVTQNSCSTFDTIFVNAINPPNTSISNDTMLCEGTAITLNAYTFGANYLWQNGSTTNTFTVNNQGKYWVKITKGICQIKDSINVSYIEKPNLNLGHDTSYCFNQPIILNAASANADWYLWQDGSTTNTFTANTSGLFWVKVKKSVCMVNDSIYLSQKPIPIVNLGSDKKICKEETFTLDAGNSGSNYLWNDQSKDQTKNVKAPGIFFVMVTNPQGCIRSDSILLDTFISPSASFPRRSFFCEGTTFDIEAGNNFKSYLWQDGTKSHQYVATKGGTYFVKIKDQNNCSAIDSINLIELQKPEIFMIKQLHVCEPDTFIKPLGKFVSCLWDDGEISFSHRITNYGTYSVTVSDSNKCLNTANIEVLSNCPGNVFIPNAFTPNNDGNNETFYPVTRNVKSFSWKLFNRWGEIIFETSEFNKGWDGTFKNENVQADVYSYIVNYVGLDEKSYTKRGNVTLLK